MCLNPCCRSNGHLEIGSNSDLISSIAFLTFVLSICLFSSSDTAVCRAPSTVVKKPLLRPPYLFVLKPGRAQPLTYLPAPVPAPVMLAAFGPKNSRHVFLSFFLSFFPSLQNFCCFHIFHNFNSSVVKIPLVTNLWIHVCKVKSFLRIVGNSWEPVLLNMLKICKSSHSWEFSGIPENLFFWTCLKSVSLSLLGILGNSWEPVLLNEFKIWFSHISVKSWEFSRILENPRKAVKYCWRCSQKFPGIFGRTKRTQNFPRFPGKSREFLGILPFSLEFSGIISYG